jgi:hypothetical protein
MRPINKPRKSTYGTGLVWVILACIGMLIVVKIIRNNQPTFDIPEEFNPQTISHDRADATQMMVVYDTLSNTYIFEFMDK